jgi:large subunit ribosomal protein L32e
MIVKKKSHPNFKVPNYGAKNRSRVKARWRKQRGIDNKKRIKKDFAGAEPTIGYKNMDSQMGLRADGNRMMLVHNVAELQALIDRKELQNYVVTVSRSVSKRKNAEITGLATKNKVKVTNGVY